nr:MAG: capsid protein [Cressdnaviricota sp.]
MRPSKKKMRPQIKYKLLAASSGTATRQYQQHNVRHFNPTYSFQRSFARKTMPLFRTYASHSKGKQIKSVDQTYEAALAVPYVPDLTTPTVINIDTTSMFQNLCTVQVGTGEYNRVGNKIALKSLRLRFSLFPNNNNVIQVSNARMMIVYDRQPNAGYPSLATFLNTARQDGTSVTGTIWSSVNINLFERFVVLMDEIIALPPEAVVGLVAGSDTVGPTEQKNFIIDRYIKLKNLETVFNVSSNPITIAAINTGALYLFSIGDLGAGAAPWSWKGETRLRFMDC